MLIITDDFVSCSEQKDFLDYASKHDNFESIHVNDHKGYLANILSTRAKNKTIYFGLLYAGDYWTDMGLYAKSIF